MLGGVDVIYTGTISKKSDETELFNVLMLPFLPASTVNFSMNRKKYPVKVI